MTKPSSESFGFWREPKIEPLAAGWHRGGQLLRKGPGRPHGEQMGR